MPRIAVCDRCGKSTKDDMGRNRIWRHRCRWEKFEIMPRTVNEDDCIYLCGACVKAFEAWMKPKEGQDAR